MGFIKWVGLMTGFQLTQSVLGAIAGFVFGAVIDNMWSDDRDAKAAARDDGEGEGTDGTADEGRDRFLFSLLVLAAHVIQADGRIMHSEMELVRGWLRTNFGEQAVEQGNGILLKLFEYRKQQGEASWHNQIRRACGEMAAIMPTEHRIQLVAMLAEIARADGRIDKAEIEAIRQIAMYMGLGQGEIDSLFALGSDSIDDAYRVLGIAPTATDDEVRAAYRRMVKLNHPDRVATLGEDVKAAATRKLQEINKAKEAIYRQRGL